MKSKKDLQLIGVAVGLSSNILGAFYISYLLEENNYISSNSSMLIVLFVILINLIWMIRYATK